MADLVASLKELAESSTRVRLAPGVIGKSTVINIGLIALWGVILYRVSPTGPWWYNGGLLLGGIFVTLVLRRELRHMREYATANPALALMEGADITEYKKFEAQAKGQTLSADMTPVVGPVNNPKLPGSQP